MSMAESKATKRLRDNDQGGERKVKWSKPVRCVHITRISIHKELADPVDHKTTAADLTASCAYDHELGMFAVTYAGRLAPFVNGVWVRPCDELRAHPESLALGFAASPDSNPTSSIWRADFMSPMYASMLIDTKVVRCAQRGASWSDPPLPCKDNATMPVLAGTMVVTPVVRALMACPRPVAPQRLRLADTNTKDAKAPEDPKVAS